jgi:hypothetical protein
MHAAAVEGFAHFARDYLNQSNSDVQQQAFGLFGEASAASLARWTRDPAELLADAELSDGQRDELKGAASVAHETAADLLRERSQRREAGP